MRRVGTSMLAIGALLATLAVAGCGQKGPLYHPERTPDQKPDQRPAPAAAPATTPSPAR